MADTDVDPGLVNLMGAISLGVADQIRQGTEAKGYPLSMASALVLLHRHPETTVEVLGRYLKLSQSGAARLVERLVQQGWVSKRRGSDRRYVALSLTDCGKQQVRSILKQRQQAIAEILSPLSRPQQQQLQALLTQIANGRPLSFEAEEYICRLCDLSLCPLDLCQSRITP